MVRRGAARTVRCLAAVAVFGLGGFAADLHVAVHGYRPLGDAAKQIQEQLHVPVNFEEAPYVYSGDLEDITDKINLTRDRRLPAFPPGRFFAPRPGELALDRKGMRVNASNIFVVIRELLEQYEAQELPGKYSVTFSDGAFYIAPAQMRDVDGLWRSVTPVMDTRLSFPSEGRDEFDTIQEILTRLGMGLGGPVRKHPDRKNIRIGARDEPARVVIARLFAQVNEDRCSVAYQVKYALESKK